MNFFSVISIKTVSIIFFFSQVLIFLKCEKLPEEILLDLKIPKCPNGQNALIDSEGLTKCESGCPDGFNCFKNNKENSEYCCPDIDLLHKLYDNNNKDFYLNTVKKYPEPKALTSKDVETAFPLFPNGDVWSNLASFPNTKILDIYDSFVNEKKSEKKNEKLMKISVLSNRKNDTTIKNTTNNTITNLKVEPIKQHNNKLLTNILIPIKNNTIVPSNNKTSQNIIKQKNDSKTLEIVNTKILPTTTTLKSLLISSTAISISNNQNNIRRKPLPSEQSIDTINDINISQDQTTIFDEKLNHLQISEKNTFSETENIDSPLNVASSFYYCDRHPISYTCNNGTYLTQLVARWYAKDNQCHTYTWSFCPGDTISMDKTLRSKEECEEICLRHGQKTNNNNILSLKMKQSFKTNENTIIDEINNDTDHKFSKNFGSTDIDEIIKMMTVEDRTKFMENQKTYASKIITNDESVNNNFFNSQETETFRINDFSKQFICVRPDTFAHICPDGFPSQLTLRWFVYENQCITFPYGYCHGDRVIEETFAKTKKECEYHCLMHNHEKTDIL